MRHANELNHFKFSPTTWIIPSFLLVVIWFVFYLDSNFNLHLNQHGILPRTFFGLQGVIFSPFLHGDLNHILNLPRPPASGRGMMLAGFAPAP